MYYLKLIPHSIRSYLLKFAGYLGIPGVKHLAEFDYWYTALKKDGGVFRNTWYRGLMLNMADEKEDNFISDKVVADFGCGPMGSLCWAVKAKQRIGIDVLVDKYRSLGIDKHNMEYVKSTENSIPLESGSVDILFTLNAMDHVDNFDAMCKELLRILKKGGEFIGSFNLEEAPSVCEPQLLTKDKIDHSLLRHLDISSYRTAKQGPADNVYKHFTDGSASETINPHFLWVRGRKP